jgi:predicted RNase H-like nuclease
MTLVGVDGCPDGWLCVVERDSSLVAFVAADIGELVTCVGRNAVVAIDIPIGLTERGPRTCDQLVRKFLGRPRGSSVFPAPVRSALGARNHREASELHERADGRRLSAQAYGILSKIREIELALRARPELQTELHEVHPEVSFALWNGSKPMIHPKRTRQGRVEREQLIDSRWPGMRPRLEVGLRGKNYAPDDLNDAIAALWSAQRIDLGIAAIFPDQRLLDSNGIAMVIHA